MNALESYFLRNLMRPEPKSQSTKSTGGILNLITQIEGIKHSLLASLRAMRRPTNLDGFIYYENLNDKPIHRLLGGFESFGYTPKQLGEYLLDIQEQYRHSGMTAEQLALLYTKETMQPIKQIHANCKEEIRGAYDLPEMTDEEFSLWLLRQYIGTEDIPISKL